MSEECEEPFEFSVVSLDGGGWVWFPSGCPEEGHEGPFATCEHAIHAAVLSGGNLVEFMTRAEPKPEHRIELGEVVVLDRFVHRDSEYLFIPDAFSEEQERLEAVADGRYVATIVLKPVGDDDGE